MIDGHARIVAILPEVEDMTDIEYLLFLLERDCDEYNAWLDMIAEREMERRGETYWPTPADFQEDAR